MKLKFMLSFALESLKADLIRSLLTLTGIFLGVITAVLIIGVGQGLIDEVNSLLSTFGTDKIFVLPISDFTDFSSGFSKLSKTDVNSLKSLSYVEDVIYGTFSRAKIRYKDEVLVGNLFFTTSNLFTSWSDVYNFSSGRSYRDNEKFSVVLGGVAANKFFSEPIRAGKHLYIEGRKFRVVGTLKEIGQAFSSTDDEAFYLPLSSAPLFNVSEDELFFVALDLSDGKDVDEAVSEVEVLLARRHGVSLDNKDFSVISQKHFQEQSGRILGLVTLGAVAVALIASVVSAIGIANTMFTSILRKKRQIGIMRAIGAKKRDLLMMFLIESLIISTLGSLAALVFGLLLGVGISSYVPFSITPVQFIASFVVGILVGVLGGILPAKRATEVSPLEAIRY